MTNIARLDPRSLLDFFIGDFFARVGAYHVLLHSHQLPVVQNMKAHRTIDDR